MGLAHNVADLRWEGPGGEMRIVELHVAESISGLFHLKVTVKSEKPDLSFKKLINADAKVAVMAGGEMDKKRYFSGIITGVGQARTGHGNLETAVPKFFFYDIEMRPKFWLLGKVFRSRVFQEMTVKKIVSELLDGLAIAYRWDLSPEPRAREYRVQYQESDYDFISRICEDDAVYFFYDHEQSEVVFANHPGAHEPNPNSAEVRYREDISPMTYQGKFEIVQSLTYHEQIGSGKFVQNEYNYRKPTVSLLDEDTASDSPSFKNLEVYEHQTGYRETGEAKEFAALRKEEETAALKWVEGRAFCRGFATGFTFNIDGHFREDINQTKWLLSSIRIHATQGKFTCDYRAMPADVPLRPPRGTAKPRIHGVLTAEVTGPSGAEVYLDKLGRCKVQCHWDREGEWNDRSSMWIRVAQNYAGKDYGIQWIPRIGHEVLLSFIDGDPDRPLVTGRVYNDHNAPPLGPDTKYQNIIKTIKDNHILFDDEDGKEKVDIRAEKEMSTLVVNNKSTTVGNNSDECVQKNKTVVVKDEDYKETVETGNYIRTVKGNNELTVEDGNWICTVSSGVKSETIQAGRMVTVNGPSQHSVNGGPYMLTVSDSSTVTVGSNSSHTAGGNLSLTAGSVTVQPTSGFTMSAGTGALLKSKTTMNIECMGGVDIKCGANTISLKPSGITITCGGSSIALTPASINISSAMVSLSGLIKHNC